MRQTEKAKTLEELLRDCTVRVNCAGKTGTGFFIAPGCCLTCAHVITHANDQPLSVYWQGMSGTSFDATVTKLLPQPYPDLALLKIDVSNHPCVFLGNDLDVGDSLYCYGFTDQYINGDSALLVYEGPADDGHYLRLKESQVRPGLSGAPLLNRRTGEVCGVIKKSRERDSDLGGRGIPISEVFNSFSELKPVLDGVRAHNDTWMSLLSALNDRRRQIALMLEPVAQQSLKQLEHFTREINKALKGLENHARVIAESLEIVQFLADTKNEPLRLRAQTILSGHVEIGTAYATTFVLNSAGVCVANSRHRLSIGKDYSCRPYFKEALQNKVGRFPAIGVTTGVLGHHVAYPVHRDDEIIGVACVEVDIEYIKDESKAFIVTETQGKGRPWIRVLADQNGVIMLSTEESWLYRTLAKLPDETLRLIHKTNQYPNSSLVEIESFDSSDIALVSSIMPVPAVRALRWRDTFGDLQQQLFLVRERQIAGGWKVLIFWPLTISLQ